VDEFDAIQRQGAFACHGFEHAGAYKTHIDLARQNRLNHPVLGHAGGQQLFWLRQRKPGFEQLHRLHLVAPQEGCAGHRNTCARQVGQGLNGRVVCSGEHHPTKGGQLGVLM
jgi:hypothetical protein